MSYNPKLKHLYWDTPTYIQKQKEEDKKGINRLILLLLLIVLSGLI